MFCIFCYSFYEIGQKAVHLPGRKLTELQLLPVLPILGVNPQHPLPDPVNPKIPYHQLARPLVNTDRPFVLRQKESPFRHRVRKAVEDRLRREVAGHRHRIGLNIIHLILQGNIVISTNIDFKIYKTVFLCFVLFNFRLFHSRCGPYCDL